MLGCRGVCLKEEECSGLEPQILPLSYSDYGCCIHAPSFFTLTPHLGAVPVTHAHIPPVLKPAVEEILLYPAQGALRGGPRLLSVCAAKGYKEMWGKLYPRLTCQYQNTDVWTPCPKIRLEIQFPFQLNGVKLRWNFSFKIPIFAFFWGGVLRDHSWQIMLWGPYVVLIEPALTLYSLLALWLLLHLSFSYSVLPPLLTDASPESPLQKSCMQGTLLKE